MITIHLLFQVIVLIISMCLLLLALYMRLKQFALIDKKPTLLPITPASLKKFGGSPVTVNVGLHITQFHLFDMMNNNFVLSGIVWFEFPHDAFSLDTIGQFTIEKGEILKQSDPDVQIIQDRLLVKYNVTIKFTSTLNYASFPFDMHELNIYLVHPFISPSQMIFSAAAKNFQVKPDVNTYGWFLINQGVACGYRNLVLDPYDASRSIVYPAVIFSLIYRRFGIRFALLILLPLMFLFYLAMLSLSIDVASTGLTITAGSITAMLAYRFVIERLSPQTGYFLISDSIFFVLLSGLFAIFLLNIVIGFSFIELGVFEWHMIVFALYMVVTGCMLMFLWPHRTHGSWWRHLMFGSRGWKLDTLRSCLAYAACLPKNPRPDDDDLYDPSYKQLHEDMRPNWIGSLRSLLGLSSQQSMLLHMMQVIQEVTNKREQMVPRTVYVERQTVAEATQVFVWAHVHAHAHMLLESLTWLKDNSYMDDAFKLADNVVLVFNGSCIDHGPYNIEVLYIIAQLMAVNGERVVYIRGKHEDSGFWHNAGLKDELIVRMRHLSSDMIPYDDLLLRFFATLPVALYLTTDAASGNYICIAHASRLQLKLDEARMGDFFADTTLSHSFHPLDQEKDATFIPHIQALVDADDQLYDVYTRNGIGIVPTDKGAYAWTVVSVPAPLMQRDYGFNHYAWACITMCRPLEATTLALLSRPIEHDGPFVEQVVDTLRHTGKQDIQNSWDDDLVVGSTMALIGGVARMGQSVQQGMQACLDQINQHGGIHKRYVRAIVYNDDYQPFFARQNIKRLSDVDHATTILLPVGSPTLAGYADMISKAEIAALFPVTGAVQFRTADLKGIVHMRASYADEVYALMDYLLTEYTVQRYAFFYQDDAYGRSGLVAAHDFLRKRGISEWVDIPYIRATSDFAAQVRRVQEEQFDTLALFCTAQAAQEFLHQIGIQRLANKRIFAISFAGEEILRSFARQHGLSILFGAVVPNPVTSQLPVVVAYRQLMERYYHEYNSFSLEGFMATSLLMSIFEQYPDTLRSYADVLAAFQALKNYEHLGLSYTFNAQRRDLSLGVWIETGPNREWRYVTRETLDAMQLP